MDIEKTSYGFVFDSRTQGDEFLKRMRDIAYKCDVISLNDIFRDRKKRLIPEGHMYGYHRIEIKKIKVQRTKDCWYVEFPHPSRMIRDIHGYWTTENMMEIKKQKKEE